MSCHFVKSVVSLFIFTFVLHVLIILHQLCVLLVLSVVTKCLSHCEENMQEVKRAMCVQAVIFQGLKRVHFSRSVFLDPERAYESYLQDQPVKLHHRPTLMCLFL